MKIGIDLRPLQLSPVSSGIGVYIRNLVSALSRIDKENDYYLLALKGRKLPDISISTGFNHQWSFQDWPSLSYLNVLLDRIYLPRFIKKLSLDVIHFTNPLELKLHFDAREFNDKSIITIFDLTPLIFPEKIFIKKRRILHPLYSKTLKEINLARRVITISENSKEDIRSRLNIDAERISVIYCGKDESFRVIEDEAVLREARRRYDLPEHFILYVGGFSLHKNVFALLEAAASLRKSGMENINLVMAGNTNPLFLKELNKKIRELGLSENARLLGGIPGGDLAPLYNLADLFVFPSLYEGFGLPVLEAMACGCPVACSNVSSLPEVAGDAAAYFDPQNTGEMAGQIKRVLQDRKMQGEMKNKGIERAKDFTWEKAARETLAVYEMIGGPSNKQQEGNISR